MTCPTFEKLWDNSDELKRAWVDYNQRMRPYGPVAPRSNTIWWWLFATYSPEFRNARLAFRRRMNCSPDSETT
jgi:hypothetical protein